MLAYSIIMFLVAILIIVWSIAIYKGKTSLIHSYHQTRVTDKSAYGRAFGKALLVVAASPLLSGIIALFGTSGIIVMAAIAVLIIVFGIGMGLIAAVQKKYNNGF